MKSVVILERPLLTVILPSLWVKSPHRFSSSKPEIFLLLYDPLVLLLYLLNPIGEISPIKFPPTLSPAINRGFGERLVGSELVINVFGVEGDSFEVTEPAKYAIIFDVPSLFGVAEKSQYTFPRTIELLEVRFHISTA